MSFNLNHDTHNRSLLLTLPLAILALSQTPVQGAPTVASPNGPASSAAVAPELGSAISWDAARQDKRITALAQDNRGRIFAASEESGVWMRGTSRHSDKQWRRFNTQNSSIADDNIYALTVDGQGRVWAGTASHGVSVFNGRSWKNYNPLQAPLGERIFDIAVSPLDGDVWIASNVGLTRYSVSKDSWTTRYAAPRLPFNHIEAIAFTRRGDIVLGTQTDGVLMTDAAKVGNAEMSSAKTGGAIEYSKWRIVSVADAAANWPQVGYAQSNQAAIQGLPSNMTTDVLVARDGTIWVASTGGLASSRDNGKTWNFTHGADYGDKLRGRYNVTVPNPFPVAQAPTWSEDYVSCLAEDGAGMLWVGHWRRGYEVYDPKTQKIVLNGAPGDKSDDANSNGDGDYVKCILPLSGQAPLIGRYGFGLTVAPRFFDNAAAAPNETKMTAKTVISSTRLAPTASTLNASLNTLLNASLTASLERVLNFCRGNSRLRAILPFLHFK